MTTGVHNNIFLQGSADIQTGNITLQWNDYKGWPESVEQYEVWRKIDSEPGYKFFKTVSASEKVFSSQMAADGFVHQYVIRAVQKGGPYESWSNAVLFTFEHEVIIPNVITPKGDEFNQYFHIRNIELFKSSSSLSLTGGAKRFMRS